MGSLSQFKEDGDALLRGHLSAGKGVGGVGLLMAGENADYSLHEVIVRWFFNMRILLAFGRDIDEITVKRRPERRQWQDCVWRDCPVLADSTAPVCVRA